MRQWVGRHGLPEGVPSELRLKEKKPVCRQPRWEPAEVWQEAEDTQKVSVQKCRQSLIKLAREISIPQTTKGGGARRTPDIHGKGRKGLPKDGEGLMETVALGKKIQPNLGDLARKEQGK